MQSSMSSELVTD